MLTMRAAAQLLSASTDFERLQAMLAVTGAWSDSAPLDDAARAALGLTDIRRAAMSSGAGSLRLLVLDIAVDGPLRDTLHRTTRRLQSAAPHVLWLVAAVTPSGAEAGIVAWAGHPPRASSFLWEPDQVVDSDAETLCALSTVMGTDDMTWHRRCVDVLGRESLTRRFYRALETHVTSLAATLPTRIAREDARTLALLCVSRLLFLRFLEAKCWLNREREFVATRFDDCMAAGGSFHHRVLLPLFFGTLNTPPRHRAPRAREFGRIPFLNGGLFTRTMLERRAGRFRFPDEQLGALLHHVFQRFRFVAREDSASWSEASVDPEMLGRAFESLMATGERRSGGVFYTPHSLVARVADSALAHAITQVDPASLPGVRILDPACGSGAFLVFVLERLAALRHAAGGGDVATIRRDVLARSIFGVDRSPIAVWLCELRLWLSVVIECDEADPMRVPPLPNLDRNIRVGDALSGAGFGHDLVSAADGNRFAHLRARYMTATGARKEAAGRALSRAERTRALAFVDRSLQGAEHARHEHTTALRAFNLFGERRHPTAAAMRELKRLREHVRVLRVERRRLADGGALPFAFGTCFAEAQAAGGFDIVIGNPPWVRLHRIPLAMRARLKEVYAVYRQAHWQAGAVAAGAAPGFASQIDLAALFVERSLNLLRPGGTLSLLLPAKLWRSLSGGGVRHLVQSRARVLRLEDASEAISEFDAVVYPSLLVARAEPAGPDATTSVRDGAHATWDTPTSELAYDATPGSPFIMLPPPARAAFDRLRSAGTTLAAAFGPPRLGVKSGCNTAFLVRETTVRDDVAHIVSAPGDEGTIERAVLRPALRGDSLRPWRAEVGELRIVWTHDRSGAPSETLPPRARTWLRRHRGALTARTDASRARRWWSLFRVDAANDTSPRVVWADFGRRPRALVLPAGDATVPLNTCYVLPCSSETDAWALAATLNSPLAAAWLNALAEPARGGYRRYLGWTVGLLPIPRDWDRFRVRLATAARRASRDRDANDAVLMEAVMAAYGVREPDIAPLLRSTQCS